MICRHYGKVLEKGHRHYVVAPEYNNCVLCLVDKVGPMTQKQVGEYLDITKMRVSQVEERALKKFTKRTKLLFGKKLFTD